MPHQKTYEIELYYGCMWTDEGICHAFELANPTQTVDCHAVAERLAATMNTTPDDTSFNWDFMRLELPASLVHQIEANVRQELMPIIDRSTTIPMREKGEDTRGD